MTSARRLGLIGFFKLDSAFIVLSGGLGEDGLPNGSSLSRVEQAARLSDGKQYVIVCSAYSVHKPPLRTPSNHLVTECSSLAASLRSKGVEHSLIREEASSYDTIGNAFFSRLLFVDPLKLKNLTIITSDFHMPRARIIFEHITQLTPIKECIALDFVSCGNGIDGAALRERVRKERVQAENYSKLSKNIRTVQDMHRWMYTHHQAYTSCSEITRETGDILNSY